MTETATKFRPSELAKMRERLAEAKAGAKSKDYKKARKAAISLKTANRMVEAGVLKQSELDKALAEYADWVRKPREKQKSRATRCGEACDMLTNAASTLDEVASDIESLGDGIAPTEDQRKEWAEMLASAETDYENGKSELESLAEEMEELRGNLEEHFSSTQRYQTIEETAGTLEGIDLEATIPSITDDTKDDEFASIGSECSDASSTLQNAASEAEGCEFPGMYG